MASRTLSQVINSLNSTYDPQVNSLRERQLALPEQTAMEERGLKAKQEQAFGDILGGARRRGLGFAGIPLGEQAKYTSTEFLPALARLKQQSKDQAMSLEDAILGIRAQQRQFGQSIYDNEQNRFLQQQAAAEQRRQFNENLKFQREQAAAQARAAAAASAATYGPLGAPRSGGPSKQAPAKGSNLPKPVQREDGGFNYTDVYGRPISALTYSQQAGIPFRELVDKMARAGDKGALAVLTGAGVSSTVAPNIYKALTWGAK